MVRMNKNGQLVAFLLLGFVLVFGFIFYVLRINADTNNRIGDSFDSKGVRFFVEQCLEETSKEAIKYVSERGGYYVLPEASTRGLDVNVPFYVSNGVVTIPTLSEVEQSVGKYVEDNLVVCLHNFSDFKEYQIVSKVDQLKVTNILNDEAVIGKLHFPLEVRMKESSVSVSDFSVTVLSQLKKLYAVSGDLAQQHAGLAGLTCLTCAAKKGFRTDIFSEVEGTIFVISTPGRKEMVRFAVK